jgi:LPXTG-motif cell wall-anchored protein
VCRRIVVLLVAALLGVGGPVTAAYAQGAGDQQYEDPFGGSGSGSGGSVSGSGGSGSGSGGGSGTIEPITPAPQTAGAGTGGAGGSAGTSSSGPATTSPSSPAATGRLPNTGLDARVLIVAGVVLVLAGAGLRLRNGPERF